jgi:hypothetical protein
MSRVVYLVVAMIAMCACAPAAGPPKPKKCEVAEVGSRDAEVAWLPAAVIALGLCLRRRSK